MRSNGADGTVTVVREVSPSEFTVVETVATEHGARTIAVDEKTHSLFLPTAKFTARRTAVPDSFEVIEVAPHSRN